jgi:hypothetical protein
MCPRFNKILCKKTKNCFLNKNVTANKNATSGTLEQKLNVAKCFERVQKYIEGIKIRSANKKV